jgi:exodeoxyribonuclease VII large subunit
VPDRRALLAELETKVRGMERALDARLDRARVKLERLGRRVADSRRALGRGRQRLFTLDAALIQRMRRRQGRAREQLDALARRLARLDARTRLARDRARLAQLSERLRRVDARARLAATRRRLEALDARLAHAAAQLVERRREALGRASTQLRALSPLEVLSRGYAIALDGETGRALVDARTVTPGTAVQIRLARGALDARVEAAHPGPEPTASGDVEAPKT